MGLSWDIEVAGSVFNNADGLLLADNSVSVQSTTFTAGFFSDEDVSNTNADLKFYLTDPRYPTLLWKESNGDR